MNPDAPSTELPDIFAILAQKFPANPLLKFVYLWEHIVFSLIIILILGVFSYLACRKKSMIPGRLQSLFEIFVAGIDDFVCGIMGPKGRRFVPFIGTLFIYILFMNLLGLVPFMRSPTASWSTTMSLSLCVFFYVQYTAVKELGFWGYIDHLAGKPRGALAFTLVMPLFMLFLHIITELIRPLSLSLRLRGNVWGDEILIGLLSSFGLKGLPLLFFNMGMAVLTAFVQAAVFCLLSAIYFALVLERDEETVQ
ncbi:MAG: F0F1 ATP synthase subunit A [Candidatus Omnitrophica bacterium]|nr:F0F1 ATP synthase subunit A [Candidatus Omnitrophota bacterium]MDD5042508.1 F0F1 ATP synthase subunit A [Candidatus Omnitrophota bacterium]MDD5500731.1 F0F1 ATP synthase subunit A [Candidatus Omnitrophota bacterium]